MRNQYKILVGLLVEGFDVDPMGTRGSFPGGKAAGAWSWPLTSMRGAVPPLPQYDFMAWCLVNSGTTLPLLCEDAIKRNKMRGCELKSSL